jgi:predicted  nucleic acid-binding Zn-ribbon protein
VTLSDLLNYYPHFLTLGGLFVGFLVLRMRGEFATREDLQKLQADVTTAARDAGTAARRVEAVESELKHLPRREDIHALHLKLTELQGSIGTMRAEAKGDREILGRVEGSLSRHEDIIAQASRVGAR